MVTPLLPSVNDRARAMVGSYLILAQGAGCTQWLICRYDRIRQAFTVEGTVSKHRSTVTWADAQSWLAGGYVRITPHAYAPRLLPVDTPRKTA